MKISENIRYIGVDDHQTDLFEGQYRVPNGMSYNSYVILDEKIAVMDTVDGRFADEWLRNLERELGGRKPDYLIIQHMEPDHSAGIPLFLHKFPEAQVAATAKAFAMMEQFFPYGYQGEAAVCADSNEEDELPANVYDRRAGDCEERALAEEVTNLRGLLSQDRKLIAENGGILDLGKHKLQFHFAPMVHWPEVMMTYEQTEKILFSADGFGKFGALDVEEEWLREARRYYIGIVGKYGAQVQAVLKKAATLDIAMICPLHGPVLRENLSYYLERYRIWSSYEPESQGIVIAYASVYGNTKAMAEYLVQELLALGVEEVILHDLARDDMAQVIADAFQYDRLALASMTYNGTVFPCMRAFLEGLAERNYRNRTVALLENGSWAPMAAKVMAGMLENCVNISFAENTVKVLSAMNGQNREEIRKLAAELAEK